MSVLSIYNNKKYHHFNLNDVLRLEADGSYTHVYLTGKRKFIVSYHLRYFEKFLEGFIRVHHKHLVNQDHVTGLSKTTEEIMLRTGETIKIARRRKKSIVDILSVKSK